MLGKHSISKPGLRLFALLCAPLAFAPSAAAQLALNAQGELSLETPTLLARFRAAALVSLTNRLTGQEYIAEPGPNWISLARFDQSVAPSPLTPATWQLNQSDATRPSASIDLTGPLGTATLTVGLDSSSGELFLRLAANSASPGLQSAQWGIFGLDFTSSRLVIPGQAGTYYSKTSAPSFVGLDYPTHWEAQFAIYESAKGSVLVYSHEASPSFKRLHASRANGNLDFGFETFSVAPWANATAIPEIEWRLKGFAGDWREPTAYYRDWWKSVSPQRPAPAPAWTRDIRAVATIRFLDPLVLDELATRLDPARTLLYLVSWRQDGFDLNYPDYTPSADAVTFVRRAHELGFRTMLHTNALGVSETNPNYPSVQADQLRLPNSLEPIGWLWNLGPGNIRRVAYISPASATYRQLFIDSIRPAIDQLQPDAIHLDAGGAIQNDGNGLIGGMNSMQGLVRFQSDILAAYPNLALGYESLTEINAPFISFAQRWSSNSPGHPVASFLYGDSTLPFGFLDQPAPDEDSFLAYLTRYEQQGILPTAPLRSHDDFGAAYPHLERLMRQFRTWQDRGFSPDWNATSQPDQVTFRSADGNSTAVIQRAPAQITLSLDGSEIYRRARASTSVSTDLRIRNWPGYSPNGVTGLDPAREYWLEAGVGLPDSLPHVEQAPAEVSIANDSFLAPEFALLSLRVNHPAQFNFAEEFAAASKGTFYRGLGDRGLINGALAEVTSVLVGNQVRNSTLVMQPPYRQVLGGVAYTEFQLPVPDMPEASFEFEVALADASNRRLPTVFAVWINGQEIWRQWVGAGAWSKHSLSLAAWRGQTIRLRLLNGPDANQNPVNAFSCWSALAILTSPTLPDRQLTLRLPETPNVRLTASANLQSTADPTRFLARTSVPGRFAVFPTTLPLLKTGDSLLHLPARQFRRTRDGMPAAFTDPRNGILRPLPGQDGESFQGLYIEPPTDGRIYASWAVELPADATTLSLSYGLLSRPPDMAVPPVVFSGASFHVFVNGEELLSDSTNLPGARSATIPLARFAGQPVVIQVAADAEGTAIFDWCFFSRIQLEGATQ